MNDTSVIPVLMCGGAGTRLWPVSRESMPKQFVALVGERSTFQQTLESGRYGAHWWLDMFGPGTFSANGYEGQFTILVPEFDAEAFPGAHGYNFGNARSPDPDAAW